MGERLELLSEGDNFGGSACINSFFFLIFKGFSLLI